MRTTLALIALALFAPMPPAAAQRSEVLAADPAVADYRLSMDKLWRYIEAQRALNALARSNPAVFHAIKDESDALERSGKEPTIARVVAVLDRHAEVRRAFAEAGSSSRDWVTIPYAVANAMMAMQPEAGVVPRTPAQKANVELLRRNESELERWYAELEKLHDDPVWEATRW